MRAQRVMRERDALEDQLKAIGRIEQELEDQLTLIDLGESEKDDKTVTEAESALKRLGRYRTASNAWRFAFGIEKQEFSGRLAF